MSEYNTHDDNGLMLEPGPVMTQHEMLEPGPQLYHGQPYVPQPPKRARSRCDWVPEWPSTSSRQMTMTQGRGGLPREPAYGATYYVDLLPSWIEYYDA